MTDMRLETTSENIARDMAEGRFPERSPPKMVPVALPDELDVAIKRAIARLQNLHDYAGSPTWERVLEEELGAIFSQAHSTIAARRAEIEQLRKERDVMVDISRDLRRKHPLAWKFDMIDAANTRAEAAEAEVKRLTEEKEALREALEPFADFGEYLELETEGFANADELHLVVEDTGFRLEKFYVGAFRRARAALNSREKAE